MRGRRTRHFHHLRFRFEHMNRQALTRERQGCDESDRPAAGDDDGTLLCHGSYCCSFTPAMATASAHILRSAAIRSANCAGVMPDGSAPRLARRSVNFGSLEAFAISPAILSTIGLGVLAGAIRPFQVTAL